jgi:hypothetical protein
MAIFAFGTAFGADTRVHVILCGPWDGVSVAETARGLEVVSVEGKSPAAGFGIKPGDLIVEVNGVEADSVDALFALPSDDAATIKVDLLNEDGASAVYFRMDMLDFDWRGRRLETIAKSRVSREIVGKDGRPLSGKDDAPRHPEKGRHEIVRKPDVSRAAPGAFGAPDARALSGLMRELLVEREAAEKAAAVILAYESESIRLDAEARLAELAVREAMQKTPPDLSAAAKAVNAGSTAQAADRLLAVKLYDDLRSLVPEGDRYKLGGFFGFK